MSYVLISRDELRDLLKASDELQALEAGGVDNWTWHWESRNDAGLFEEDYDDYIEHQLDQYEVAK